jgi:hypothetical protein
MKQLAWKSDNELTPRGEEECAETFEGKVYRDFHILNDEKNDRYEFAVSRRCQPTKIFNVVIPMCGARLRGPKTLRHIFSNFTYFSTLTDLVIVTLLFCDATDFRNQSPKRSHLC